MNINNNNPSSINPNQGAQQRENNNSNDRQNNIVHDINNANIINSNNNRIRNAIQNGDNNASNHRRVHFNFQNINAGILGDSDISLNDLIEAAITFESTVIRGGARGSDETPITNNRNNNINTRSAYDRILHQMQALSRQDINNNNIDASFEDIMNQVGELPITNGANPIRGMRDPNPRSDVRLENINEFNPRTQITDRALRAAQLNPPMRPAFFDVVRPPRPRLPEPQRPDAEARQTFLRFVEDGGSCPVSFESPGEDHAEWVSYETRVDVTREDGSVEQVVTRRFLEKSTYDNLRKSECPMTRQPINRTSRVMIHRVGETANSVTINSASAYPRADESRTLDLALHKRSTGIEGTPFDHLDWVSYQIGDAKIFMTAQAFDAQLQGTSEDHHCPVTHTLITPEIVDTIRFHQAS